MRVRAAIPADMPALREMGRQFHAESGYADLCDFDGDSFDRALSEATSHGIGAVFVAEVDGELVGMVGGLVFPFYFCASHLTGQELFWWVAPTHRRGAGARLYDALEQWAREQGCQSFSMIALDHLEPERVGGIYRRLGYRASEHTYIKRL